MSFRRLDLALESGLHEGVFTCGAWAVFDHETVQTGAAGEINGRPVGDQTCFDLASLTKVVSTTSLAVVAVRRGLLDLGSYVQDTVKDFPHPGVTYRHLLEHRSGLPPYLDLTERRPSKEEAWEAVAATGLDAQPGSRTAYSCLGFIVLGRALEALFGTGLDHAFQQEVAGPLGLDRTGYRGTGSTSPDVPPTASAEPWRSIEGGTVQGTVHDPLAFFLGGVSGNAGLFGSAMDTGRFGQAVLAGRVLFSPGGSDEWTKRDPLDRERGLGWDFKSECATSAGRTMSPATFGHTGFTGTSIWIDPTAGFGVALLTNSVLCKPDPDEWRAFRSAFCDLAGEALRSRFL